MPVLAFLEEHQIRKKPASDDCDLFGGGGGAADVKRGIALVSTSPGGEDAKRFRDLPPGWTKRESRSQKGVFYYVHEAKGLSQFTRPET